MMAIDDDEFTVQDQVFEVDHNPNEALLVLHDILRQHPWSSVSEPDLPSLRIESPPRECLSSPLPKGGSESETTPILSGELFEFEQDNHAFLVSNAINYSYMLGILKTIRSKTVGNKEFLKVVFIVLNILVEVCQAAISQGKNEGKLARQIYLKLSIITSSVCLMMALLEALHEGSVSGVVWQNKGYFCWFYHPGNEGKLFGRFSLYFGLISSMMQLVINITEILTRKDVVQFDYIPLLLAVCYSIAAMISIREKKLAGTPSIRCSVHTDVEGTLIECHESRVFQCPQCQMTLTVEHNRS